MRLRNSVKSAADIVLDLKFWRAKNFLFFLVVSLDVLAFYTIAKTNAFDRFRFLDSMVLYAMLF